MPNTPQDGEVCFISLSVISGTGWLTSRQQLQGGSVIGRLFRNGSPLPGSSCFKQDLDNWSKPKRCQEFIWKGRGEWVREKLALQSELGLNKGKKKIKAKIKAHTASEKHGGAIVGIHGSGSLWHLHPAFFYIIQVSLEIMGSSTYGILRIIWCSPGLLSLTGPAHFQSQLCHTRSPISARLGGGELLISCHVGSRSRREKLGPEHTLSGQAQVTCLFPAGCTSKSGTSGGTAVGSMI